MRCLRKKVTIQQIADMAGVSKFAVSRALSGKSGVSNQTREMILKVAGQLGYFKQNPVAAAEAAGHDEEYGKAGTVVVLFPNIQYQNHDSPYWGPIFDGISARLGQRGCDIITLTEPSGDKVFSLLNPKAIQGIITLGTISTQILLEIKRLDIPVVMVDYMDPAYPADAVFVDNVSSMRELMLRLLSKGYKSFQFVGDIHSAPSFRERWLAFRSVLEEYEIEMTPHPVLIGPESGENLWKHLPKVLDEVDPEVFVCVNDITAVEMIAGLKQKGRRIPDDCGVTGFDNTHRDNVHGIGLTTVDIDKEWMGRRAVDKLLWRIANRGAKREKTLIAADVIIRDSIR